MKKIQVLKPRFRVEECLSEIRECLEIGWSGMGFKTTIFEEKWKEYSALPNAHFLNSATVGLHLAVKILKEKFGWKNGDEIISTPLTFVSTNHAILYENMRPIFADIDSSLNLDPASVLEKITPKTKAIVFVGIGGNGANLEEIINIARERGLKIILDAAHMSGSKIDNRHVGYNVDVAVFSFQAVKNLPTADSGMICFTDKKMDEAARKLSWLGINKDTFARSSEGSYKWDYEVDEVGYKYHGNSIIAAMGIVGLKYLDEDNAYRRKLAALYELNLIGKIPFINHKRESSRHIFQVVVENRNEVIDTLSKEGIFCGVHYKDNTLYAPFKGERLKNVRYYSDRILSLPLHLGLEERDIIDISERITRVARPPI
ncbi:MAG: aminotransferase class V-fold PLP-dependent enzyme [Helicobacteraceae bacterium]|jgi:dTDP-4-amino-4,6-dideoxygalactose transaminase|nr:aminotransferase class V-fold PLP-dependent enzyme [Helicobacteraceae bacterium]